MRLDEEGPPQVLVVGPDGVTFLHNAEFYVSVAREEAVAVQRWANGARTVWGRDGFRVFVHPDEWHQGARAVAAIDAWTPPELAVEMATEAESAYLAEAERLGLNKKKKGLLRRR